MNEECEYFLDMTSNYLPQDLTQVERIWLIEHVKECENCRKLVNEKIQHMKKLDFSVKELAELDKNIIS